MRIIRWSVDNPLAVGTLWLCLTLLGAVAAFRLVPTRLMPAIESPLLGVVTRAPGLSPEDVERRLTDPVEARLANSPGVRAIRSTSMHGMSVVTLEYPYRYDMQRALVDVGAGLSGLENGPRVLRVDPLNLPVLRLALRAGDRDEAALRDLAENEVARRLKALPGVEAAWVFGGERRQVDISVDRDRLAAAGLSMADVRRAVEARAAGGAGTLGGAAVQVSADGGYGDVRVGRDVLLRDIAFIDAENLLAAHGHGSRGHGGASYRFNGRDAVEVSVLARPDASTPAVVAAVRAEMAEVVRQHPHLEVEEAFDGAHFVEIMRRDVAVDLVLAVVLTGLVLLLFLGDMRGTLVALVTIPASLACAVLCFAPLGLSIDSSSLVGLLLAIGRLVDDAIVDLSAVTRHLAQGKSARDAAVDGCSEVRRAVVSATLIVCLALLPLTVCGGLTQDMFTGIVWPFVLSLGASLAVAFTLTPMLAARVYRGGAAGRPLLDRLDGAYARALRWALSQRALVLCAALGVCMLGCVMVPWIGSEMMPMADVGQAYGVLEAVPGTTPLELRGMVERLERIIAKHPAVQRVSVEIGSEAVAGEVTGYDLGDMNTARIMLTLGDMDGRRPPVWDIVDDIQAEAAAALPNLRRLTLKEMGADVMASAMAPVEIVVYGPRLERVSWLADQTARLARGMPALVAPGTAWSLEAPTYRVQVDPRAAAGIGASPASVAAQAAEALESGEGRGGVRLHYRDDQRRDLTSLRNLVIAGGDGRAPLSALARIERGRGPTMIMHDGLRRADSVTAYYRPGGEGSMQATMDLMMRAGMNLPFPPGYGLEQRGDMTQMMDAFGRLLRGFAIALVLIYLALLVQFRSWRVPLVLMAAIPLEITEVLAALLVMHQTFSTVSLLGLVVLNGMDVTASILLVDRMTGGGDVVEAARTRLRPILMTVIVTLVVMAPLALWPRGGLDAYAPLATVVVGGLLVSTPMTLLVIPVLYDVARRREEAAGGA